MYQKKVVDLSTKLAKQHEELNTLKAECEEAKAAFEAFKGMTLADTESRVSELKRELDESREREARQNKASVDQIRRLGSKLFTTTTQLNHLRKKVRQKC
jgi:predicted  nucleic acid-binding Zn-ribbon protein